MSEFKPVGEHRREESLAEWQSRLISRGASPAYVGAIASGDTTELGDPSGHYWGQEESEATDESTGKLETIEEQ